VDTAGLALLVHFVALIRRQGREAQLIGKSENLQTLRSLQPACRYDPIIFSVLSAEAILKAPSIFSMGLFACLRPRHFPLRCWAVFTIR
jgi:hypothetical protein